MNEPPPQAPGDPGSEQDPATAVDVVTMDKIVALCKRRGFVFPSSEIYGGVGSTYDFGHYGVLLKGNVKAEWWRSMLQERDDIVALDSAKSLATVSTWLRGSPVAHSTVDQSRSATDRA